jgi:hypothetical protein
MCTNEIVFEQNGKLYLDSSMTQSAFTKSRFSERMSEQGFFAQCIDGTWKISPWIFTGTLLKSNGDSEMSSASRALAQTVLLEGSTSDGTDTSCFKGHALKDYFDEQDQSPNERSSADVAAASAAVCAAIEQMIDDETKCNGTGAGGIFVAEDFTKIIFLPEDLFETSVTCRGDSIYSEFEGKYVYRTLEGTAALRFTQAAIAYRALTGELPFTQTNTTKRHEDYLDHNFTHLENKICGIDSNLSFYIDNALMRSPHIAVHSKSRVTDGRSLNEKITSQINNDIVKEKNAREEKSMLRAGMHFPFATFYHELGLTQTGSLPDTGIQEKVVRQSSITPEQFASSTKKAARSFNKSLATKRWFRHHRTSLTVSGCIVAAVALIGFSLWHSGQSNATTKGLTSSQTVEMLYSAINNLDIVSAQSSTKGKDATYIVDTISNFYVISKQRSAYDSSSTCVPPASWICWSNNGTFTIYGLSQLTIDGKQGRLTFTGPLKKTHPVAMTQEDGKPIENKQTVTHTVHFFHIYSEGDDQLHVSEHNDTVICTWIKDRWLVTKITQSYTDDTVDFKKYVAAYKDAIAAYSNDAVKIAGALRSVYPWISTESEVSEAKMKIIADNMFNSN